eukprot:gene3412-4862_t
MADIAQFVHMRRHDRLGETRPAATRLELVGRRKQRLARDDVDIDARRVVVQVLARSGTFGSAALSTAAGLLLAISSAVSHDLIKGVFNPNISEKNELLAGKISMAGAIVLAGYLGLNPPGFAAGTVALAFGIAASSLFPVIMMGIFSKTMNSTGAIVGMLTGLAVTLFYVF